MQNPKIRPLAILSAILVAVAVNAFASPPANPAKPAAVVTMSDEPAAFIPATVSIKAGQAVQWKNTGKIMHSVTSKTLPAGAKGFDSGFMMPGADFSHTFTVAGTYEYVCIPHANSGMTGKVIVAK